MLDKRLFIPALIVLVILIGHYFIVTRHCFHLIGKTFTTLADGYIAGTHSVVFVTVPSVDVGKKIAHGAVEHSLAACVNIIPAVTSVYLWEGKVEEEQEQYLFMKTITEKVPELTKYVRKNHPYDVPQVISLQISGGNPDYLDWVSSTVLGKQTLANGKS